MTQDSTADTVAAEVNDALRMKGMLLENENVLRAMEQELAGVYIPVRMRQNGEFYKDSRIYSRETFDEVQKTVYGNIEKMGTDLLCGRVAPFPAKGGGNDPCGYCPYAGLCNNTDPDAPHRELGGKEKNE